MITFKNRFAEFDNLDDSQNENVLRNCYYKEFHRNFLKFNGHFKGGGNNRYSNYNDIRLKNFRNDNNTINSQRQSSFTPFPRIPLNKCSNYNNDFNSIQNDSLTQRQNNNLLRSTPNYSKFGYNNNISTPIPSYNNNYNNMNNMSFNNNNFDNSFNNSNDSIQYFNESENLYNNNNYDYNNENNYMDNSLNMSNDFQYSQDMEYQYKNNELENEIEKEKQKQLLLEQQRLNRIEKELKELRLKRNIDLKRKLEEKINEQKIYEENKLNNIRKVKKNKYSFRNRNRNQKSLKQSLLEESFKSNILNDRIYMNQLIDEINRMKISQNEANDQFRRKMDDLFVQNSLIQNYNKDLMSKLKEVKYAVKEKEDNPDTINDYLIEQQNKRKNNYKNYFNKGNTIRNNYYNKNIFDNNKKNYLDKLPNINKNYFLGKKDKDEEEFNLLNQNLVSGNNGVVVSPLLYNKNNKSVKIKSYINKDENNKDDIYSLLRKNNDRLDKIKELEERMNLNY